MADLTIVAASVVKSTGATLEREKVAGESVTQGQVVYLAADDKWYKALSASGGSALASGSGTKIGIAMNAASAGQPLVVQVGGNVTIGAAILVGVWYYLSNTAGGICPVADLGTGDFSTILGYGATTGILTLAPTATGLTLA